jgi:hypothetical protein
VKFVESHYFILRRAFSRFLRRHGPVPDDFPSRIADCCDPDPTGIAGQANWQGVTPYSASRHPPDWMEFSSVRDDRHWHPQSEDLRYPVPMRKCIS